MTDPLQRPVDPAPSWRGALLTGVDLTGAQLTGLDLTGTNLVGVNLSGATIGGTLTSVDLSDANLSDASFSYDDLYFDDFAGDNMTGVNFANSVMNDPASGAITGVPAVLTGDYELIDGYLIGETSNLTDADLTEVVPLIVDFEVAVPRSRPA